MASLRLAAHLAKKTGYGSAAEGLARALARNASPVQTIGAIPTAYQRGAITAAPAKPKASASKPEDRVKVVAHALETDPALKGKAEAALCFLADPAFAGVTGQGVIKLLKAGATTEPPKLAITTTKPTATRKRSDALGGGNAPTAESKASWDRVYDRMFGTKA